MKKPRNFYPGLKIANLTLIERQKKGHNTRWVCKCICGKTRLIYSHEIGITAFSCGCTEYNFKTRNKRLWKPEEVEFLKLYCGKLSVEELSVIIGKHKGAIRDKLYWEGISLIKEKGIIHKKWKQEDTDYLMENYLYMKTKEIANILGVSVYTVRSKKKDLGIENKRKLNREKTITKDKKAHRGYYRVSSHEKGKGILAHRKIYQDFYNIELTPEEKIHHIDGDRSNNDINNLFKCNSNSDHYLIHSQLQKVAYQLIKKGVIKFNKDKGEYYV